ncbi:MAG: GTP-binding protein, partial [Clostridiales bacterium]|nr:GTP-binding protein [Clostridiales bacterium]
MSLGKNHITLGTAGHIDHGKTALVKKITGYDLDRLKEEKKRGITIDLGFAALTLPSGNTVSIVDVPGHEKFVKTMVAGVSGINCALLVIALDEGIMPQTLEHINILTILGVKEGLVALTKKDLVSEEIARSREKEIREYLKETGLKDYPLFSVSSITGEGIDELLDYLD